MHFPGQLGITKRGRQYLQNTRYGVEIGPGVPRAREHQRRKQPQGVGESALERVPDEQSVPREDVLAGDFVEHPAGFAEAVRLGVEGDEFGGEEVVGNDGRQDYAGVELPGLAGQLVVGAVLEQAAESAAVEPPRSGRVEASQGLLNVAVDGV